MVGLQLSLLGAFEVLRDGLPIVFFRGDKARPGLPAPAAALSRENRSYGSVRGCWETGIATATLHFSSQ
jgi:hypothetical protein